VPSGEFDITARSWRLHAQRWGPPSAPLLLALPGLTGTVKSFGDLGPRLGGETQQVVALDLRGRGGSEATPPGTYGWDHHALDVLAVADALGFERFTVCGLSMGGSVAMKIAELAPERLDGVVLIDVAGRVDPGVGAVVRQVIDGGVRSRASTAAIEEDRAYTATQDPYARWEHLTMPTLLVRATQEMRPGAGFVVPADDCAAFRRTVARSRVVEVDADHMTIAAHPESAAAIAAFLAGVRR
jgi:pimeloyl-ACP methyl ester carboxylesterase